MTYNNGDVVIFKFTKATKETHSGIIVSGWTVNKRRVYEIASMNHGMSNFTIGEGCILKKIG